MTTFKVITGLCDEMIDPTLPKADVVGGPLQGLNGWLQAALAQEPNDAAVSGDLSLRGPVTRWIGYAFGNPRMLPSEAAALLPLQPGDPNPFFQIVDAVEREGGDLKVGNSPLEMAEASPIVRKEWLQIGYCFALVYTGGDAIGFPVYFVVDDLTVEVPETFPNRTYTVLADPEDPESESTEVVHTWESWYQGPQPFSPPVEIDGTYYCVNANTWDRGKPLDASVWVMGGVDAITVDQYQSLLPPPEGE
jgi:hypothetical protein